LGGWDERLKFKVAFEKQVGCCVQNGEKMHPQWFESNRFNLLGVLEVSTFAYNPVRYPELMSFTVIGGGICPGCPLSI
jgi:hypothetical protein